MFGKTVGAFSSANDTGTMGGTRGLGGSMAQAWEVCAGSVEDLVVVSRPVVGVVGLMEAKLKTRNGSQSPS